MTNNDHEMALRADVAWLQALNEAFQDIEYAALLQYLAQREITPELQEKGLTREKIVAAAGFGDNTILRRIAHMAITSVDFNTFAYNPIDIMSLHIAIPTVNGFCVMTPNLKSPAIVLNNGLVTYVASATHLTLGLTHWTDTEFCTHYSKDEMLDGLFRLAKGLQEKKPAVTLDIAATKCIGNDEHAHSAPMYEAFCMFAELFIVYHELGHIALGHLNKDNITYAFGGEVGQDIPIYNRSQREELDADTFAFRQLVKTFVTPDGAKRSDVAYGVGCLLMLVRSVEAVSSGWAYETHPPALVRWQNLKTELTDARPAALDSIDYFFEWIDTGR